ncbi:MAG: 1-(5-phosphoribosyl)-5-[(5-phosphoribosylamino)methylideneamino]imidazole-4-carboxamide isomerase [Candidatus Omnitrophica bacterium]|nr:1-(5-phosphoribosyl)-5-[(5-phosphoribosylamino)methylideneamino]imidazole-4-carboxamide isomerase [Candidatus Omnitrophota bacterium]
MLIIPAIDIQGGCVVRLTQGAYDKKVYSRDPQKTAKHWQRQGAELLHVVDLDGAFSGTPRNLEMVKKIIEAAGIPVEFGGGVRDLKTIKNLLQWGAKRVVLGTKAIEDRAFLKNACAKFKDGVIVSIDAKNGSIMTKGWKKTAAGKTSVADFVKTLIDMGQKEVIFTDITKDGTLRGPSIQEIKKLIAQTKIKVIASGGVSSLEDIRKLSLLKNKGLSGVIVGKALYEGRFTLSEALKFA